MRVIIAGAGALAYAIARELLHEGYTVILVDRDPRACERVSSKLPEARVILGNILELDTLEEAGIEEADVFIAATGDDFVNMMAGLLAKQLGVPKVIVRVKDPAHADVCKKLGLEHPIVVSDCVAEHILVLVRGGARMHRVLSMLCREFEFEEISVHPRGPYDGLKIEELPELHRKDCYPILLIRNHKMEFPRAGMRLQAGDTLIIIRRRARHHFFL